MTLAEWDRALPERGFEVFHRPSALEVLDSHTDADLRLFGGFKGDRPVALLPLFVSERAVGTAVLSPPPGMGVPRLGPLTMPASPKRRKREKVNHEFVETVLEELDVDRFDRLFRAICPPSYTDPRPFGWADLDVETAFTYRIDPDGRSADDLLGSFSKSLRREIRDARDLDLHVEVEVGEAIRTVYEETRARYAEQDREFSLSWPYVRDLTDALAAEDRCRVYVARTGDDEFVGGITVLYSNDVAYFWQGGTRTIHEGVGVNGLLHWRVLRDLVEDPPRESVTGYDLMGANTERLCRYKSKFGGELVPYYVVESRGRPMAIAKRTYELLRG
jgi:hypothetical protein